MSFYRLFYKATGLMPRKEILKTCRNIGEQMARELQPGDNIDIKRFKTLLENSIGKKKSKNIVIADDFDTFKKYAKNVGLDDFSTEMFFQNSKSAVLTNPNDNTILLSLRTAGETTANALNLACHELEHVLFKRLSPRAAMERLYLKIRGKKFLQNYIQKYGNILNESSLNLQRKLLLISNMENGNATGGFSKVPPNKQGLLSQLKLQDNELLQKTLDTIIEEITTGKDKKLSLKLLKAAKIILKDESRAYKTGGAVERYYADITGHSNPNATKSEMLAMLYDETILRIKSELKKQQIERFKNIFKIKSKPAKNENI